MKPSRIALAVLFSLFMATSSCSQTNSTGNSFVTHIFVGSTPCDTAIKFALQIPPGAVCDFIKWDLSFGRSDKDSNAFQLTALYGESLPNTNGFTGGGKQITISGKYTTHHGKNKSADRTIYHLYADKPSLAFMLIEMDKNILHFADANGNLIVGNGGWGYVLNRIQE